MTPQETIAHLQSQLDECRKELARMTEDRNYFKGEVEKVSAALHATEVLECREATDATALRAANLRPEAVEAMVKKGAAYLSTVRHDPDNFGDSEGLSRAVLTCFLGKLPTASRAKRG